MSAQVGDVLAWVWLTCIAALALVSVRSRRALPRVLLVVMCWTTLVGRELAMPLVLRHLAGERRQAGLATDDFIAGGRAVLDHLDRSGPAVLFPAVALGFVALLGFKDAPWLRARHSALRFQALIVAGLCIAWSVAALATRSVGAGTGFTLIWGLAMIAWATLDRRSDSAEEEPHLTKAA